MEEIIGANAGKVWEFLSNNGGAATPSAIAKALTLKAADVERAIGWLAREGKLSFDTSRKNAVKVTLRAA